MPRPFSVFRSLPLKSCSAWYFQLFLHLLAINFHLSGGWPFSPWDSRHLQGNITSRKACVLLDRASSAATAPGLCPLHPSCHSSGCSLVTSITATWCSHSQRIFNLMPLAVPSAVYSCVCCIWRVRVKAPGWQGHGDSLTHCSALSSRQGPGTH